LWNAATRICNTIGEKVAPLRKLVLEEFKSEFLEVRKDKLVVFEEKTANDIGDN